MAGIAIVFLCLFAVGLPGQEVSPAASGVTVVSQRAGPYRLGEGDLLEIKVFGVDELGMTSRIGANGAISMPLVGQVRASGLTREDLEQAIATRLADLKLVKDPQVMIFVKEYRSQPVYVLGAVNKPGQYVITSQLRLIDAISMAGGLDPLRAGNTVTLKRAGGEASEIELAALLEKAGPNANLVLGAGDIVQVAERKSEVFYVVGEVGRPGVFEFPRQNNGRLLVSQAIASAGGPVRTAKTKRGILVRYGAAGERQQMAVDVNAIIKGRRPDVPVKPNDIIFIPGSTAKTLGYSFAQAIPWAAANGLVYGIP